MLDVKPDISKVTGQDIKPSILKYNDNRSRKYAKQIDKINKMEEELRMTARREQKILDLKRKYLKSEEERRRLLERGQSRLIVESEPKDIKPIIHTDGVIEGGGKEESDDDDIVFVKEVKGKAPKAVGDISYRDIDVNTISLPSSDSEAEQLFDMDANPDTPRGDLGALPSLRTPLSPQPIKAPETVRRKRKQLYSPQALIGIIPRYFESSDSDSDSDSNSRESSYTQSDSDSVPPPREGPRMKRKVTYRLSRGENETNPDEKEKKVRIDSTSQGGVDRVRLPSKPAGDDENQSSPVSENESDDNDLYRGPRITTLSVDAIKNRMDRAFQQEGLTKSTIERISCWWPKTILAKYHGLQAKHIYILTLAVHRWWSHLEMEINSANYQWPVGWSDIDRFNMSSRVGEITHIKAAAAKRGERDMKCDGGSIPVDTVIKLVD